MSLFPPPEKLPTGVKVAWATESNSGFCDSRLIHHKYWKPFNTITIPLLSPSEFYTDVLEAARNADTTRELEQALEEKYQQRRQELAESFDLIECISVYRHWSSVTRGGKAWQLIQFCPCT